jgi:hypothetical protein
MELLIKYYEGQLLDQDNIKFDEVKEMKTKISNSNKQNNETSLRDEKIKPKKHL